MSKNPFDDEASFPLETKVVAASSTVSTNPFEEDAASSIRGEDSQMSYPDDDDGQNNVDGGTNNNDPAEASWQYLGNLPYRRIPIYSHVRWGADSTTTAGGGGGLASYPSELQLASSSHHQTLHQQRVFADPHKLLSKTTFTKCAGCPNGGPIAVVTLPLTKSTNFPQTTIRILTVSGKILAQLVFPPPSLDDGQYSPYDILEIGFTSRCILIVVLKDSLCLTYNLRGEPILPPFFILVNSTNNTDSGGGGGGGGVGTELQLAQIYEGGAAVLAKNKDSAIVELFDKHDDYDYLQTSNSKARRVFSESSSKTMMTTPSSSLSSSTNQHETGSSNNNAAPYYALVTPLPTAIFANAFAFLNFCSLAVLPRTRTLHRHPEVYLSTSDHSVVVVNVLTGIVTDMDCRARISSPIVDMCFAPNGRFLACFTEHSMLTVISTSFETKVLDFDTSEGSNNTPPLVMEWCGEDSVVLHWKNLGILMVGPYGDWLRFPYENTEHLFLLPEMDCCRVITDSSVEILQRVPPATANLLRIGSIDATAMLLDAADAHHSGSATAEEQARSMVATGMLEDAILTCTDSATKEFDIGTQKRLLRAASFGMHFSYKSANQKHTLIGGPTTGSDPDRGVLPSLTTASFVDGARKLRILNALRNPDVGFLLTAAQYDAITPTGVIARLIAISRPGLATEISKYLGLPKAVQLYARASKAAAFLENATSLSDTEAAEKAIQIINGDSQDGTSLNRGGYAIVAMAANKLGRPGVANLLLMLESSVADKVPALISTGAYSDAIAVATTAKDADFIFSTLMEYEKSCILSSPTNDPTRAQSTFLATVVTKFTPEAFHMLRRYRQASGDFKGHSALLLKAQRTSDAGISIAMRALTQDDFREKQGMLSEASRIFGLGKETAFHKTCTEDCLELLKDQETLRKKYGSYNVASSTTSVTETILSVLKFAATVPEGKERGRILSDADKLARKYRLSEKRYWHIRVKGLAESKQWEALKALMVSKRPPIGYKPFVRAAIKAKDQEQINVFLKPVSFPDEKYELLCEASMWKEALNVAVEMKDARRVLNVKNLCGNEELQQRASAEMASLA